MSQLLNALNKGQRKEGSTHWQWGLPSAPLRATPAMRLVLLLLLFFAGAGVAALGWQLWQQFSGDGAGLAAAWRSSVGRLVGGGADTEAPAAPETQPAPADPQAITGVYKLAPLDWSLKPLPAVPEPDNPKHANLPESAAQEPAPATVSPELAAAFKRALAAVPENSPKAAQEVESWQEPPALPLAELPEALRSEVPPMSFSSHVYSSTPANRLVRVNGRELREGDWLTKLVQLVEIRQDQVIMRVEGQSFSLPALAEWN